MRKIFSPNSHTRGFTLIEILVSVAIFAIVMVICMGAITSVLSANRKSQSLRSVMDNLNYSLEAMTRAIRFGQDFHCGTGGTLTSPLDCSGGGTSLSFLDVSGSTVTYGLSANQINKTVDVGLPTAVTSPDVTIQNLTFYVLGTDPSDVYQPRVIVVVRGTLAGKNNEGTSFTLETTISQRKLDYK